MFWARDGAGAWRWLLPGAALGALTLVRPEYLAVSVLLAILATLPAWQSFARIAHKSSATAAGRGAGSDGGRGWCGVAGAPGAVVVVLPWTVRNVVALERLVPVSTGGGQVLYAGSYLPSDGNPEKIGAGAVAEHPDPGQPGGCPGRSTAARRWRRWPTPHPGEKATRR